jgi:hypothetical protein
MDLYLYFLARRDQRQNLESRSALVQGPSPSSSLSQGEETESLPVERGAHWADQAQAVRIELLFLEVHLFHLLGFEVFAGDLAFL